MFQSVLFRTMSVLLHKLVDNTQRFSFFFFFFFFFFFGGGGGDINGAFIPRHICAYE